MTWRPGNDVFPGPRALSRGGPAVSNPSPQAEDQPEEVRGTDNAVEVEGVVVA